MQKGSLLNLLSPVLGEFLSSFTLVYIIFLIPSIINYYKASIFEILWIPISLLVSFIPLNNVMDRISSLYGRDKLYYIGLILYIITIIFLTLLPPISIFIILTFIMGISLSIIYPNSIRIHEIVNKNSINIQILFLISIIFGITIAYLLNGYLRISFITLIIIPVLIIFISLLTFFNYTFIKIHEEIDILGSFLFAAFISLFIFFIMLLKIYPITYTLYFLIMSLVFLSIFIIFEKGVSNKFFNLSLLKNKDILSIFVTNLVIYISIVPIFLILPLYYINILNQNYSLNIILLFSIISFLTFIILNIINLNINNKILILVGLLLISISYIMMSINIKLLFYDVIAIALGYGISEYSNYILINKYSNKTENYEILNISEISKYTGILLSIGLSSLILSIYLNRNYYFSYPRYVISNTLFINAMNTIFLIIGIFILFSLYFSYLRSGESYV
ncbi:MAG: hypothetical protein ACP5JT_03115 [Thermoplasmata archaeon]